MDINTNIDNRYDNSISRSNKKAIEEMILKIILLVIFSTLSGISKAVRDTLTFHFDISIFSNVDKFNPQYWNPDVSYVNKNKPKNKFIRLLTRTILVPFTDILHLSMALKTFSLFSMFLILYTFGLSFWYFLLFTILSYLLSKLIFEICFKLFVKKSER